MRKTTPTEKKFPHKQQKAADSKPCLETVDNLITLLEDVEEAYHAVRLAENEIADRALALIALIQNKANSTTTDEHIKLIVKAKCELDCQNKILENKTIELNKRSEEVGINPLELRGYKQLLSIEQNTNSEEIPSVNKSQFYGTSLSETCPSTFIGISNSFTEKDFWNAFIKDLKSAQSSVLIVSPYIYERRTNKIIKVLESLIQRGIDLKIITKLNSEYRLEKQEGNRIITEQLTKLGATIKFYKNCHQKVAIVDNETVWEGSLNILSHTTGEERTKEHMRRLEGCELAKDLYKSLRIEKNARLFKPFADKKAS